MISCFCCDELEDIHGGISSLWNRIVLFGSSLICISTVKQFFKNDCSMIMGDDKIMDESGMLIRFRRKMCESILPVKGYAHGQTLPQLQKRNLKLPAVLLPMRTGNQTCEQTSQTGLGHRMEMVFGGNDSPAARVRLVFLLFLKQSLRRLQRVQRRDSFVGRLVCLLATLLLVCTRRSGSGNGIHPTVISVLILSNTS